MDLNQYFHFKSILGTGSTSNVYCVQSRSNKIQYALKIYKKIENTLIKQKNILQAIKGYSGFTQIINFPETNEQVNNNFLLMERLGISLKQFLHLRNFKLSFKTITTLSLQMLDRIETLHNLGYVHNDIKPQNFAFGIKQYRTTIFLIDFGMCQSKSETKVQENDLQFFKGNLLYSSLNAMKQINNKNSYLSDLQSLAYIIIQMITGDLPWKGIQERSLSKLFMKIKELKQSQCLFNKNSQKNNIWCNQLITLIKKGQQIKCQQIRSIYCLLKSHLQLLTSTECLIN